MSWFSEGLKKVGRAIGIGPRPAGPTFAGSGYQPAPIPVGRQPTTPTGRSPIPASPYQSTNSAFNSQFANQFSVGDALGWLKDNAERLKDWMGKHGWDVAKAIAEGGGNLLKFAADHADDLVDFFKENAGNIIDYGLGAVNLINAAKAGKKSEEYADKAREAVEGSYNERAGLRSAGIQGMLNPSAGNAAKMAGVNAIQAPRNAPMPVPVSMNDARFSGLNMAGTRPLGPPPMPVPLDDPRLALTNRTGNRNPFTAAPVPISPGRPV